MTQEPNHSEAAPEDLHVEEDEEEYIWPRLLGAIDRQIKGNEYVGHFTGIGRVTADYDEGSFLSDTSFKERHRSWRKRSSQHTLEMEHLFPEDWKEAKVEYEITVRARRVRRPPAARTSSAQKKSGTNQ